MNKYLLIYLIAGPVIGAILMLHTYGMEWLARYYESWPQERRKNWPDWMTCYHGSPERGKTWVVWLFAINIAIPITNVIIILWLIVTSFTQERQRKKRKKAPQ